MLAISSMLVDVKIYIIGDKKQTNTLKKLGNKEGFSKDITNTFEKKTWRLNLLFSKYLRGQKHLLNINPLLINLSAGRKELERSEGRLKKYLERCELRGRGRKKKSDAKTDKQAGRISLFFVAAGQKYCVSVFVCLLCQTHSDKRSNTTLEWEKIAETG